MVEQAQSQLQSGVSQLAEKVSNSALPLQKLTMQNGLQCFDKYPENHRAVSKCIADAQKPTQELDQIVNKEFGGMQNGVQGCQQRCLDPFRPQLEAVKVGGVVSQAVPSNSEVCHTVRGNRFHALFEGGGGGRVFHTLDTL